jgi:GAF domain-containing protein/HAMP domain-containing protein
MAEQNLSQRTRRNPLQSVTSKFIIVLVVILLVVAGVQIWYNATSIREQVQLEAELLLETDFEVYEARVKAEAAIAQALAISLADRSDIRELYQSGDRDALYDFLRPMFEQMAQYQVVHLYIHNPDGTVFVRVHNKERFGDDATYRPTLADSLNNKIVTGGIDIGPNRIGTRAVAPMYDERNNFIGLVEVGIDYDQAFLIELKELAKSDFTVWVTYEAAAPAGLAPVAGSPDSPIRQIFYYASTNPGLLSIPAEVYTSVMETRKGESSIYIGSDGAPYITYLTPILGYQGAMIGIMEISEPYAQVEANLNAVTLTSIAITLGLILLAIAAIGFFNARVVLSPLGKLAQFAQEQLAGNVNTRVEVHSGDEFEELADTFNNLAQTVQQERALLEQRVADRTQALVTSAEVSRRISNILDKTELATTVVAELKNAFNYYHAHIYLLNNEGDTLLMTGGTGEVGAMMLEQKHKIAVGRGLVGRAAETGQIVLVEDTRKDPNWLPNPLLPETKAEIAIPIKSGEKVMGVLDVQNNIANSLSQDDANLISSIADQVSVALQNISATEQSLKRAKELQAVAEISTAASSMPDTEEMLAQAVHLTQRKFGLYHCHVFLLEEELDLLRIVACGYKEGDEHEGTHGTTTIPVSQEQSLVARSARNRAPVIVNNVRSDPNWLPNPLLPDTMSELAVPMISNNILVGVLDVQSEKLNAFTDEDANIQATLASQIAAIVQNNRSFSRIQSQAEREARLNLIGQRIQATTSVSDALQIAARELGHALGQRSTMITLDKPTSNTVSTVAAPRKNADTTNPDTKLE